METFVKEHPQATQHQGATWMKWLPWALVLFSFLWGLGSSPVFDEDEGAFSEATRELLASGDYITTRVNGVLRFDKPILTYWFQALSASVFGINEFAMRLPSGLAAIAWMWAIYAFAQREFGRKVAQAALVIAACSLQITIIGKAATADALLNLWLATAMFSLHGVISTGKRKFVIAFWIATALGFLTKGPVALLIPGAVGLIYAAVWRKWQLIPRLLLTPDILLFAGIALPWYWLEYQAQGPLFLDGFFLHHNIDRFNTSFEGHAGGLFYYIPVCLIGLMPFTPLLIRVISRIRFYGQTQTGFFLLTWFFFVVAFFSLSGTKLPHYAIYGYSPMIVLMAFAWQQKPEQTQWPFIVLWTILVVVPLFLLPVLIAVTKDPFAVDIMRAAGSYFGYDYYLMMVLVLILFFVSNRSALATQLKLAGVGLSMLLIVNVLWMPRLGQLLQSPVNDAAAIAAKYGQPVVMWGHYWPSFIFYHRQFVERRQPQPGDLVLTKRSVLPETGRRQVYFEKNGIVLVRW